jgi:hypothetical protein
MTKEVAVFDENGKIIAINLHDADYELKQNEMIATRTAYVGGTFEEDGCFYPEPPFQSWIKNGKGTWIPPIEYPEEMYLYTWDEDNLNWKLIDN